MKRKIIQVGVGGWGGTWIEKVLASGSWELGACVDVNTEALLDAQAAHGIDPSRCFTSVEEAAAAISADAALVVVPPQRHLAIAAESFDAGLHVLVEKPLADTMDSGRRMVRLADEAGRHLMVSQNYRFKSAPRAVREILRAPWLGPVTSATVEFRKAPHFTLPDNRHGYTHYRFVEDMCVHHFDLMRAVLGDEPVAAYAQARNPEWSWFAAPPLVNATIELAGGGLVQYYGSWISRGRETTWDGDWFIECENGQVVWADNRVKVRPQEVYYTVYLPGFQERAGWMERELSPGPVEERSFILEEFARRIADGMPPETSGRDNLRSMALTYAVAASVSTGERRELETSDLASAVD